LTANQFFLFAIFNIASFGQQRTTFDGIVEICMVLLICQNKIETNVESPRVYRVMGDGDETNQRAFRIED